MANYVLRIETTDPRYNLALEAHLSKRVREGDVILYLWQNDHTVVLGKNQNVLKECKAHLLEAEGGYVARRTTGGGAVYQDMGNVCFTFLASPERYDLRRQSQVIIDACRTYEIETECSGRNDILTMDGYKFSGNAFSKTSTCSIQHGTIMVCVDTDRMIRYLTPSKEKMIAKGVDSIKSRVINLCDLNPKVTTDGIKEALFRSFEKEYGACIPMSIDELDGYEIEQKYQHYCSWDWVYGISPQCELEQSTRFSWGGVELHMTLEHMRIQQIKLYTDSLDVELPKLLEEVLLHQKYPFIDDEIRIACDDIEAEKREKIVDIVNWIETWQV